MPELPEVETVRLGLLPVMEGRRILRAEARRPDLRWPLPEGFAARLSGRRVTALRRRSKYLLAELSSDETLIVHLGMSGRLLIGESVIGEHVHAHGGDRRHDHVLLDMEGGTRVTFNDARRFGSMDLWPTAEIAGHRLLAGLGPEPLGNAFGPDRLIAAFADRAASVKALLLDQRVVAGLGNIYVCEALFRAGIAPQRPAGGLAPDRTAVLAAAIRAVLSDALAAGGSSLRDYRQADGELGYFQHSFAVYGREGEPCTRDGCGGTVQRAVQTGRSSFWCPACQW